MKNRIWIAVGLMAAGLAARAGVEADIDALVPRLAAPDMAARYEPQIALQTLCAKAARPGAEPERLAAAKALAAKAQDAAVPQPARVWILRQLELIGGAESVPALSKALADPDAEIREVARRALERNPSPDASAPLRAALEKGGDAPWKIGLLNALGRRADAASIPLMAAALKDKALAPVAADTLSRVGTAPALAALLAAYDGKDLATANALVAGAARARAADAKAALAAIDRVLASGNPPSARAAALVERVKADPANAPKFIPAAAQDPDRALRRAAVAAAAQLANPQVNAALAALLPRLPAETKTAVIGLLDAAAKPALIAAAGDAEEGVRLAAVAALGRAGDRDAVPVLLKAATSDSRDEKVAAEMALARVKGPGVSEAVEAAAAGSDPKVRAAAMAAIVARAQASAVPMLIKAAAEEDSSVSRAAFAALKQLAGEKDLDALAGLILTPKSTEAVSAFKVVAARATDKAAVSKKLLARLGAADAKGKAGLFDALGATGGDEALAAVATALSDAATRDGAVRALANWGDWAAAAQLVKIAGDAASSETHQVLALRGTARLVQACTNTAAAARAETALAALAAAKRDDEKKQLLSALSAAPDAKALPVVQSMLADPAFKKEAAFAAVPLAEILVKTDKASAKALATAARAEKLPKELDDRAGKVLQKAK